MLKLELSGRQARRILIETSPHFAVDGVKKMAQNPDNELFKPFYPTPAFTQLPKRGPRKGHDPHSE